LQNWVAADDYFDEDSARIMGKYGFFARANVGPGWRRGSNPAASDFEAVRALSFRHLLSAHGEPLRDTAHADLSATFARLYEI
jgi:hypothetical protein